MSNYPSFQKRLATSAMLSSVSSNSWFAPNLIGGIPRSTKQTPEQRNERRRWNEAVDAKKAERNARRGK